MQNQLFIYSGSVTIGGREFVAEPYLSHSIGPMTGYGVREKCYLFLIEIRL